MKKVLQSAIANAENNHDLDVDDLVVSEASVGRNLVMKRFHARARGRGARIEKPFAPAHDRGRREARREEAPKRRSAASRREGRKAKTKKKAPAAEASRAKTGKSKEHA